MLRYTFLIFYTYNFHNPYLRKKRWEKLFLTPREVSEQKVWEVPTSFILQRFVNYVTYIALDWETAVAQWLRCCATNRKVVGSICWIFY